jgi:hypothetical protein
MCGPIWGNLLRRTEAIVITAIGSADLAQRTGQQASGL